MYALPRTPMGRRALWLLLPVLLYILTPVYMLMNLLIPDSWRAVSIAVVIALIGLAVASLVTAGLAILRDKERSVVLVVVASLTFLLVVTLAVGEALGGH
jgi:cytochrome bd-type quinol oxidase subunit 2